MDSSTLLSVVGGVLVLSIIILTSLCLHCKGSSQTKFKTQENQQSSQTSQGFIVIRPNNENPLAHTLPSQTSIQLTTSPLLPDPRRLSACPSSNESDYVNQNDDEELGYELAPEKNQENDYLDVLPDDTTQSQHSLASSANSGQNYENVTEGCDLPRDHEVDDDDDDDDDDEPYINVHKNNPGIDFQTPVGSYGSSDGHDSSDYVNAPNQVSIHLG